MQNILLIVNLRVKFLKLKLKENKNFKKSEITGIPSILLEKVKNHTYTYHVYQELISNLFSNFDDVGTEANAEIIKNSINSSKNTIDNDQFAKEITESKKLINEISSGSKLTNIKLANLVLIYLR